MPLWPSSRPTTAPSSRSAGPGPGARWSACQADPAGPPDYLGDLGGLGDSRELILPELTVQPGAGHYPWLDDPTWFTAALLAFLG